MPDEIEEWAEGKYVKGLKVTQKQQQQNNPHKQTQNQLLELINKFSEMKDT